MQSESVSRTTRCASAEKRSKALLQGLPYELKQKIFGHALDGELTLGKAKGVLSSMLASRNLEAAALGHLELQTRLQEMKRYATQLRACASGPDVQLDLSELLDKEVDHLLGLCSPDKRRDLLKDISTQNDQQNAQLIQTFGNGLKRLAPTQRGALMATTLDIEDPEQQRAAFAGMAKGLVHLGETEQKVLLDLALNGSDAVNENGILRAVCSDFSNLRTDQQERILNHLPNLPLGAQINVLASLSAHLPALGSQWRGAIVAVLDVPHDNSDRHLQGLATIRAHALDQLDNLDGHQQTQLIAHLSHIVDEDERAMAFGNIASKLVQLEADSSDELKPALNRALEELSGDELQSHILSGLCASLELLPEQSAELIRLATEMADGSGAKGRLLGGLGGALKHLDSDERDLIFADALDNTTGMDRRLALNGLARGAHTLNTDQLVDLLEAMGGLNDNDKAFVIQGLAPNMYTLTVKQRDTLISLVNALAPPKKSMALAALGASVLKREQA
ncbi:hypothetical protein [Pseudomonas sp. GL-B-16]|uniref:hypothetical protein n=1 Tax=Pseudomonas sp. GL-B-16 TaxID=2832373 RepID=UPI001CBD9C90|nr:hypothetical protein [Pseudomonas sp. GL-B-16]